MALSTGDKLGPYEIVGPLGAGGMGEVYRARDLALNREVAIKVLPAALASDADYLARFQREAQALAALNHPNIAAIYGLEGNAIVMELVEGEMLRGPLPLKEAMGIARQIAEALEAAHEKGIIHRDLKPGNVMVTASGVVKVLDFGLAKGVERSSISGANSPTLTMRATEAGLILGTAGYMSPEQAAGKAVDRRADIWSFGVVLWELITGKRLFEGETISHTLADVIKGEIDFSGIPEGPVRELVRRCLDRNLKERLSHIAEARYVIDHYAERPAAVKLGKASRMPWVVCAVLAVVAGYLGLRKTGEAVPARFDITPPAGAQFSGGIASTEGSAISPDGRTLAFMATNAKGETLLHVRPLDSLEALALAGTENAGRPFWSPDSKLLGFMGGGKLKRVEVVGGSPVLLCEVSFPRGGTWSEEGVILFADRNLGLLRIPASGGTPAAVTKVNTEAGEAFHYSPQFLPGGKEFLFLVRGVDRAKSGIYLGALDGRAAVLIQLSEFNGLYDAMSRRLLYLHGNGTLMARRLELDPPRLTGDPVIVAEGVGGIGINGYGEFSISGNGTLFYGRGGAVRKVRFGWVDRAGKVLEQIGQPVEVGSEYSLSPDGIRVAYGAGRGASDIWVMGLENGISARLTFNGGSFPRWSPDGRYLYYGSGGSFNTGGISRKAADGSGEEELVWKGAAGSVQSISPDGKQLLFGLGDVLLLPLGGEQKAVPYVQTKFAEWDGVFSPDGRWVAYTSDESGRQEVYIQGFPERRGKWLVTAEGGYSPSWRAHGKELYWRGLDGRTVMAAAVELQAGGVKAGRGELLFRGGDGSFTPPQPSRDGKRFLEAIPEGGEAAGLPMVVVLNWAAGLGK